MDKNNKRVDAGTKEPDFRWLVLGALAGLIAAGYGILRQDTTAQEMRDAVDDFAFRVETADLALIYYAGHGSKYWAKTS